MNSQPFFQGLLELVYGIKFLFFDHLAAMIAPLKIVPEGNKRPLVLLSGFLGRTFSWRKFASYFRTKGHPVYPVSFGSQVGDITRMTSLLIRFIEEQELSDCILVCHSLGGILALNAFPHIKERVYKIITLSTPFKGTYLAYFFSFFKAASQLKPRAPLVRKLEEEFQDFDKVISLRVQFDEIVHPLSFSGLHPESDIFADFGGHLNTFMSSFGIHFIEKIINTIEGHKKND